MPLLVASNKPLYLEPNAINALFIRMKRIKILLIMHQQKNNQTSADANRQTNNINSRMQLMAQQIAESNGEVAFNHGTFYLKKMVG